MPSKLTIKEALHKLEVDFGYSTYKRKDGYDIWKGSIQLHPYHLNYTSTQNKELWNARGVHILLNGIIKDESRGKHEIKKYTHEKSRRKDRDNIKQDKFDKIPLNQESYRDDPWNWD
jgi:hypothetical protein